MNHPCRALVLCTLLVALPSLAVNPSSRPWAEGVSQAQQDEALRIFREANALFEQSKYSQALALYHEALKSWDHPAIRFNTAVSLVNLDQPLDAYDNLEAALRFGDAPFDVDTYKQAELYLKLLSGQVAELKVSCAEVGAQVVLDGKPLFVGPGTARTRLSPGPHQLVASKAGFATETAAVQLEAGKVHTEVITLQVPRAAPVVLVRRWPVAMPYLVLGGGVALALIGIPVFVSAQSNFSSFDADLARVCPLGCTSDQLPQTTLSARATGRSQNIAAVTMFSVGGAAIVSGVILVALNGLRPAEAPLSVVPVVGPGLVGVSSSWQF